MAFDLDPKEVLAAVVGPPPEKLKDLLRSDALLVELRERTGTPVRVTVARLPSSAIVSETVGTLHVGDEPNTVVVGDSVFTIDPAKFVNAAWVDATDPDRRLLFVDLKRVALVLDFNLLKETR